MTVIADQYLWSFDGIDLVPAAFPEWELEAIQLDPGPTVSRANALCFPDLTVMACYESHRSINHLHLPADWSLITFLASTSPSARVNGALVPNDRIVVTTSTRDHSVVIPAGYDAIQIEAANALLLRHGILSQAQMLSTTTDLELHVPLGKAGRAFRRELFALVRSPDHIHQISRHPVRAAAVLDRVIRGLSASVGESALTTQTLTPMRNRYRIAEGARQLIDTDPGEALTATKVAETIGISERELRYAFGEVFETSPYQYIQKRRLHEARKALRQGSATETTVTEIAFSNGFLNFGRFSGIYRQMFGELPSQTLLDSMAD
ncbi:AraC family transcriptional regulator [Tropicibacter sp. Alg240-R139]|uniref:helix-turn-helix transcriptional regulator n=1 Tax=Tropicibacter sp. Alg240-R139 TaxID=2305991 RepID=UPI0013E0823F|nr:helix-turn-helix domain-containing protein [Tropicibacter sp. Alg240-R139]